jgi:hypothetical protein
MRPPTRSSTGGRRRLAEGKGDEAMRRRRFDERATVWTVAALFVLLLQAAGCANLTAIREFASVSSESAAYTTLVTEYVESPMRVKRYQPSARHAELERMAAERRVQREVLLLRHQLIQEYMDALGQLAADEAVVYDREISALGRAATDAKFLDAKEGEAFSAVTRILLRAVTDGWRRRQLTRLVEDTNPHFQVVVGSLRTIVRQGFAADAENERVAINRYYTDLVRESRDRAGIEAVKEWQEVRLEGVGTRDKAIRAYAEILDKIGRGHQRLYDGRHDVSARAVLADLKGYSKELRALVGAVKERL